ncbi:hypothetical protein O9K51_09918 [Purpureocillium lavendulum]|uniref:Calcineurin-like phosphoesterase domain-containing protein n=1 Tax=Purpureocillium lavendulum TaxID=1247861 RepID=A0AB34FE87_9HYPO|nr:hypothetical protein O9K51_09918 [Purpureocillium lavendulum]
MNSHLLPFPYNQTQARHIPGLGPFAKLLYSIHTRICSLPTTPPPSNPAIRVVCMSDTHNETPAIPDGDLLIHAGDLTKWGTYKELQSQLAWLSGLPHAHKVVIAGNHDRLLDPAFSNYSRTGPSDDDESLRSELEWKDLIYLANESVTLRFDNGRSLKIYGSPFTPEYGNWAFQYPAIRDAWTGKIPDDTDVVVTHCPPALHRDAGKEGDGYLLRELRRCKPSLTVFGHAHDGYGEDCLVHDGVQGALDDILLRADGIVAVMRMLFCMVIAVPNRLLRRPARITRLVNAALAPGAQRKSRKSPIVLDL